MALHFNTYHTSQYITYHIYTHRTACAILAALVALKDQRLVDGGDRAKGQKLVKVILSSSHIPSYSLSYSSICIPFLTFSILFYSILSLTLFSSTLFYSILFLAFFSSSLLFFSTSSLRCSHALTPTSQLTTSWTGWSSRKSVL